MADKMLSALADAGYMPVGEYVERNRVHAGEGTNMKTYLACPMRGIPEFNFPAFRAAAAKLRAEGHKVFNPAEQDTEWFGVDLGEGNSAGCEKVAAERVGMDEMNLRRECFWRDMAWICREAECVALLPGWQNSKGATAERATAIALGLKVVEL